jgi:hypothetical protein
VRRNERRKPISIELALILSLIAHLFGDYILQTHAMATQKTSSWKYAILHGVTYGIPFLVATHSIAALLVIVVTHIIIDRFRLARHLMWFKNQFAPKEFRPDRSTLKTTGFPAETPAWLSTWVMIIADNAVHVAINTASIIFLGTIWVIG